MVILDPAQCSVFIDITPRTPGIRSARVGRLDNKDAMTSKEDLKDRIISIVHNGADGTHCQALIQETCAWLKEQTPEEVSDLAPGVDHH
jgi:hypothetical protein